MTPREIARHRLANQRIAPPAGGDPAAVVAALGAVQAQDYSGALWAIGLRVAGSTQAGIEGAIAARSIVRTWPMRGTLHFVAAADVRWMLELLTPRVLAAGGRRQLELELDATVFARCREVLAAALRGGRPLPRADLLARLEAAGIPAGPQRGYHILCRLAQEQFLCFGPRAGKQPTFTLLDEWVPVSRRLSRDESLAELARRYFSGHGPATVADLAWWSGLKMADARTALDFAAAHLAAETVAGRIYWRSASSQPAGRRPAARADLLPGYDEYLLGYQDRGAVLDAHHAPLVVPGGNAVFRPMLVIDGKIAGTWKAAPGKKSVAITPAPFQPLKKSHLRPLTAAAARYGAFLGLEAKLASAR